MESIVALGKLVKPLLILCGGAVIPVTFLVLYGLLPTKARGVVSRFLRFDSSALALALMSLLLVLAWVYLAYPGYLDHLDPTIASLGQVIRRGGDIYPWPDTYPYHGILYGPALALLQSHVMGLGLPAVLASKIPSVVAFGASILLLWNVIPDRRARGYLILLLPFGFDLFWNRPEPFLLLLVALALRLGADPRPRWLAPLLLGVLAGTASALKIHGALYVGAAYLATGLFVAIPLRNYVVIGVAAVASFLAFFAEHEASLPAFFDYLHLASRHGLSATMLLENLAYLAFMWFPLVPAWRAWMAGSRAMPGSAEMIATARRKLLLLALIQLVVAVLAAKPGSGVHHFEPLIPVNAYILWRLLSVHTADTDAKTNLLYLGISLSAIAAMAGSVVLMASTWSQLRSASHELTLFRSEFPNLVMGVSAEKTYRYSYLRVMLNGEQIDYAAYTDLAYSGVPPESMIAHMSSCALKSILMPNGGDPFSLPNFYDKRRFLFPESVRSQFAKSFEKTRTGTYYSVYVCHRTMDGRAGGG